MAFVDDEKSRWPAAGDASPEKLLLRFVLGGESTSSSIAVEADPAAAAAMPAAVARVLADASTAVVRVARFWKGTDRLSTVAVENLGVRA
jgi:hypothetical protein